MICPAKKYLLFVDAVIPDDAQSMNLRLDLGSALNVTLCII